MRILIATGGSSHSDLAVLLGYRLAEVVGTRPTIMTVVRHEAERAHGKAVLEHALALLPNKDDGPRSKIEIGEPAHEIIEEARVGHYDLIVLGEQSPHRLLSRLLSPTSERVLAHAHCPVLIAKAMTDDFNRILICDSGLEQDPLLKRFTEQLRELLTPETDVTVLHVMSQISAGPGVRGWQLRADAESLMQAHTPEGELLFHDLKLLQQSPAHPHAKIRHGRVVDEILAESECDDYDLVVIGAHRTERWQRLLLDDIAQQIIRNVHRPLLVIHHHNNV